MNVRVALTRPHSELYSELGGMVLDALASCGCKAALIEDGDRDVLEADLLLLVGDSYGFDGFAELLSGAGEREPVTALWQLEPLPPPTLSERAERIGLRASVLAEKVKLPPGPVSRLLRSLVPLSARQRVREAIGGVFFLGFDREMAGGRDQEFMQMDNLSRRSMMTRYRWLKRRLSEGWLDYVFVSNVAKAEFLAGRGVRAALVPVGYHPLVGEDLLMDRDLDVVFIGEVSYPRRDRILKALRRDLASRGLEIKIAGQGYFGSRRAELLSRARVSLSLASHPYETQGIRFLMSMGCGALVVSEPLYDPTPFKAGEHFVEAGVEGMAEVIAYYVEHEAERLDITRSARDFVTRELTMRESVKKIIGVCSADSTVPSGHIRRRH